MVSDNKVLSECRLNVMFMSLCYAMKSNLCAFAMLSASWLFALFLFRWCEMLMAGTCQAKRYFSNEHKMGFE